MLKRLKLLKENHEINEDLLRFAFGKDIEKTIGSTKGHPLSVQKGFYPFSFNKEGKRRFSRTSFFIQTTICLSLFGMNTALAANELRFQTTVKAVGKHSDSLIFTSQLFDNVMFCFNIYKKEWRVDGFLLHSDHGSIKSIRLF